ncbi:peptidoglycan-binding protein [Streptomyces polyrhachis]|uniref:Peptidoglycan-binding protein n=1 Tax=Streptomyces polyrhachis TaxID=1282885 RepID=A0ABW2G9H4_9ACTN
MSLRRKTATAAMVIALGAGAALTASPASASNSYNGLAYVQGSGTFTDDWQDEGRLSTGENTYSNATCLWQKILWAEGKLAWNSIDGIFGPATQSATKIWQTLHGTDDDGVVGSGTFTRAGYHLIDSNGDGAVDTYRGSSNSFLVSRDADGHYLFYDRTGAKRAAGYNYRTCA